VDKISLKLPVNILKFLVMGKAIEYGGPMNPQDFIMVAENVFLPSIQMIKQWEDNKKIVGGLPVGQRAGVMIIESASAEELAEKMQSLPFWALNTWEVIPLQSFESGVENVKRQIANAKKMAEMMPPKPM